MNKTIAAYATTAILLGFTIMLLPLAIETGPPSYTPQPQFLHPFKTNDYGMASEDRSYGLISEPLNLLPSSLILLSGLIVAISVYGIIKRQMF